uniref:Uncharacterized protein n=1 Tax=Arundo donax TaxID=35708 RepID=A0A0A9HZP3_ARUDO
MGSPRAASTAAESAPARRRRSGGWR